MKTAAEDLLEWLTEGQGMTFSLVDWEELNGLIGAIMQEARDEARQEKDH